MDDQQTRRELNRRYWESDDSVSEIATDLNISRRALYEGIDPLPAGAPCPECGGALGFRNRTAAENSEAECPDCGRDVVLDGVREPRPVAERASEAPAVEQERAAAPLSPVRRVPAAGGSGVALGLLLLAGLGVGALAAYVVRHGE